MAAPPLVGTFRFQSSDNLDEYLKGLGVGLVLRKVQSVARPAYTINYEGETNKWTMISESAFKTKEITFKRNESFDDETFDCRKCQTSVAILEDGRVMKWNQVCEEGPDVDTTITATPTGFSMAMKCGEHACEIKSVRGQIENAVAENHENQVEVEDEELDEAELEDEDFEVEEEEAEMEEE